MATALWVRTIRHHKIDRQTTAPCTRDDPQDALAEACHFLDLPKPIWLDKTNGNGMISGKPGFRKMLFLRACPSIEWKSNISIRKQRSVAHRIRAMREMQRRFCLC